jgi:hypothetical protein
LVSEQLLALAIERRPTEEVIDRAEYRQQHDEQDPTALLPSVEVVARAQHVEQADDPRDEREQAEDAEAEDPEPDGR